MQALPVIVAIISLAATVYATQEQAAAADEAKKIADQNAARQASEAEEVARRKEKENARVEGMAQARAFASGAGGQSQATYLDDLKISHEDEVDWIRRSGDSRADIMRAEGSLAQDQGRANAVATAASGLSDSASWYMQYD